MFAPTQKVTDVENDIQAKANAYVRPAQYPGLGDVNMPGYTASFGKCRPGIRTRGVDKGEHTDSILQGLGYCALDIEALKEKRVVQ
ncbi:MAG: hypothetical protein RBR67_06235 [Desulfobacterium sp.]|jgi:crotonobetainyl-CoA:carnitine CoA-transferase CaiB-like acyl-CoA transferase|nr:hypothetical protein [Desulfobacterium sp.]